MQISRAFVVALVVLAAAAAVTAQSSGSASPTGANGSPQGPTAIVVPHELELEEQLQLRTDERNYFMNKADELGVQVQQLQTVVGQVLESMRAERSQKAEASRDAVGRKLVKLLGGDWDKADRWDWQRRGMTRPGGTFVPLVQDEKKPEAKE